MLPTSGSGYPKYGIKLDWFQVNLLLLEHMKTYFWKEKKNRSCNMLTINLKKVVAFSLGFEYRSLDLDILCTMIQSNSI